MNNLSINGRTSFNFSYDGVTNKDTGQNAGNYAAPALDSIAKSASRPRTSRPSTAAAPARRSPSSRAAARGTSMAARRSTSATMRGTATSTRAASSVRHSRPSATRRSTRSTTPRGRSAVRCSFRRPIQQGPQQAVLLLVAGHPGAHRSGQPEPAARADALERQGISRRRSTTRIGWSSSAIRADGQLRGDHGGPACFPGNVIPAGRIDPNARALLNLFPLPNAVDPTGTNQYNYVFQTEQDWPRNDQVLRVDWNIAQTRRRTAGCSSATRSAPAASRCSARRRLAADADEARSTPSAT